MTISWQVVKNKQAAKLVFKEIQSTEILEKINSVIKTATFGGVPVLESSRNKNDQKEIFLMKKKIFNWSQVRKALENAMELNFVEAKFTGTPER